MAERVNQVPLKDRMFLVGTLRALAGALDSGDDEALTRLLDRLLEMLEADGAVLMVSRDDGEQKLLCTCRKAGMECDCPSLQKVSAELLRKESRASGAVGEWQGGSVRTFSVSAPPFNCRLALFYRDVPPGGTNAGERELLQAAADTVMAVVLETYHCRDLERRMYESAALSDIGRIIVSSLDMDKVLYQVVRLVAYIMNAAACLIVTSGDERDGDVEVKAEYGLERVGEEEGVRSHALDIFRSITEQRDVIDCGASVPPPGGLKCLAVPLAGKARVYGAIIVYRDSLFQEHEKSLMLSTSLQASIAIENARLHRSLAAFTARELALAADIQRSLLPRRLPENPLFDIGSTIAFMKEVGGDYYDLIGLGGDRYGISIGDVSGKSVPAAILVAMAKYVLRAAVAKGSRTAEAISEVNDTIIDDLSPEMFISMFYAELNLADGSLEYTNAGHEPPLLFRDRDHSCAFLEPTGVVLGIIRNAGYESRVLVMEPSDWLLLFTDGVTEARDAEGRQFGSRGVFEAVRRRHHISAQAMATYIYKEAYDFCNGNISDDVAVVAIRRR